MTPAELRKLAAAIRRGEPVTVESVLAAVEGSAAALEAAQQTATVAIVEAHVRAGRVTPALREDALLLGKSLSPEALDERLARWPVVTRPAPTGRVDASGPNLGGSALEALEGIAKGIAMNEGVTAAAAFSLACERHPNLYAAHREQHLSGSPKKGTFNVVSA